MDNLDQFKQKDSSVISLGDWVITMLIMMIPIANIIMLFIWAFGGNTPESKSNWAKASLIFMAVSVILAILFWGIFAAALVGAMGNSGY